MNYTYCSDCEYMEKRNVIVDKEITGHRYHCKKNGEHLPINTTGDDLKSRYCISGKAPRKEHNTRCGINEFIEPCHDCGFCEVEEC